MFGLTLMSSLGVCQMQLMGKISDLMEMLGIDHNWMVRALNIGL